MKLRHDQLVTVVVAAGLSLGAAGFAETPVPDADQDRLIEQVLVLSGAKQQIEQAAAFLERDGRSARQQHHSQLPPEDLQRVGEIFNDAFRPGVFYAAVKTVFKERYDQQQMAAMAAWLQTPLAVRITAMKVAAGTPVGLQEMQAFAQHWSTAPPPPEARVALLRRLDTASESTDSMVRMMRAMMQSTAGVIEQAGVAVAPAGSVEQGLQAIEQQRPLLEQRFLVQFLFKYRNASDEDLTTYIEFLESPTGKWFTHVGEEALTAAGTRSTTQVMRQLIPLIKASQHTRAAAAASQPAPPVAVHNTTR